MIRNTDFVIASTLKTTCEINFHFDLLIAKIQSIYSVCFPMRKVKFNANNLPWINDSIRLCIAKRDKAYKLGHSSRFKHYRQKVKLLISQSKERYVSTVKNLQISSTWSKIKNIANIKRNHNMVLPSVNANSLLCHFTSIKPDDDYIINDIESAEYSPISLSHDDIYHAIKKLKKGGGIPFIHPWVLKNYSDIFAQPLKCIFEASMNQGFIPSSMKLASITPVPKVKRPNSVDDFRPITCTSPFLKLLETLVYENG